MYKRFFSGNFLLLFLVMVPLRAQVSSLELLNPEINGRTVTLRLITRNFYPERGDLILVQRAADQYFNQDLQSHQTNRTSLTIASLAPGDYYLRARIHGPNGEDKSDWSNLIWFQIASESVPKPVIQMREEQPVRGDQLSLSWTPIEGAPITHWQLQQSPDPDFPVEQTQSLYPASNLYKWSIDLSQLNGSGILFFRIRAMTRAEGGLWSNTLLVRYEHPQLWYYPIAHIPTAPGWETWLELHAPDGAEVSLEWYRRSDLGNAGATRLVLPRLNTGAYRRARLSDEVRGVPVLLVSDAALAVALIYRGPTGSSVCQIHPQKTSRRLAITGLLESNLAGREQHSALVIANQSAVAAGLTLKLTLLDSQGGFIQEQNLGLGVGAHQNEILLIRDLIPEMPAEKEWSITVEVQSSEPGLNLLAATFSHGHTSWQSPSEMGRDP